MQTIVPVDDRALIERFARRDRGLHLYELGDLDPFFWPDTTWYGLPREDDELAALALLYAGQDPPTLLLLGREDDGAVERLARELGARLPDQVYAHTSPGVLEHLGSSWRAEHHGRFLKMLHRDRERLFSLATDDTERLGPAQLSEIQSLYSRAYPDNWFDPRMLDTGHYYGIRVQERLACVAGVHVYSPRYRVAALGNITTDPACRGQGLARRATARLCASLYTSVDTIGLNVRADNHAAIRCYESLGFDTIAEYDEHMLWRTGDATAEG